MNGNYIGEINNLSTGILTESHDKFEGEDVSSICEEYSESAAQIQIKFDAQSCLSGRTAVRPCISPLAMKWKGAGGEVVGRSTERPPLILTPADRIPLNRCRAHGGAPLFFSPLPACVGEGPG